MRFMLKCCSCSYICCSAYCRYQRRGSSLQLSLQLEQLSSEIYRNEFSFYPTSSAAAAPHRLQRLQSAQVIGLSQTSSNTSATASVTVPAVLKCYYCFSICCSACRVKLQLSLQLEQLIPRSIADLLQSLPSFRVATAFSICCSAFRRYRGQAPAISAAGKAHV
jgi:hypothetical protein